MPATIEIHEMSALDTGTDKTGGTIRFKAADNATVDASNPLVKPSEGSTYSYTKKLRAYMEVEPSVNVQNLRWYSDGNNDLGTGITLTCKDLGVTWGANYNTAMAGGANFFGKTSVAPLDGDAVDAGPFVPADVDSYIGDLIELQMAIDPTVTQGATPAEGITLAYDEI